jgi:glycosyltransferase involved in cell wall biosynthesis
MESESHTVITAIILTLNESKHLRRCLESLRPLSCRILVVDSFSTDDTREIARSLGAEAVQNPWPGTQAAQLNWALENLQINTPWTMRLDADEYLTPELQQEILQRLSRMSAEVGGIVLPRRVIFKGKTIRHGGFYPQWLLRIWRTGTGRCEARMMDEHMVVSTGSVVKFRYDLVDENLNDIYWWTAKHNSYARREAVELLDIELHLFPKVYLPLGGGNAQASRKRWIKEKVYRRLPIGVRPALYFLYRFVVLRGFLDHPQVWIFHFLQAFWYRLLVDVNVWEFRRAVGTATSEAQRAFLKDDWGISG